MINSEEQLVNEIVDLSQQNITDIGCWQKFMFSVRPTKECFLCCVPTWQSCKPNQRDVFCFAATAVSVLLFPTIGLCIGSAFGLIKNNDPVNINSVSAALFLLGFVAGFRYGITIGDYFFNLVNRNSNENDLNINDSNDTEKMLQEVTIIDENFRVLPISGNRTETSRLDSNLIKIQQTIQVDTKKHDIQQAQDALDDGLSRLQKISSVTNNGSQRSNVIEVVAEIHCQTNDVSSEPAQSPPTINL